MSHSLALRALAITTALSTIAGAQQKQQPQQTQLKIPIRSVSAPTGVTTEPLKNIPEGATRELPDGRFLVNAPQDRVLLLYDKDLAKAQVLADTMNGSAMAYTFAPRIVPFLGDSTMMFDTQSRSLFLITPTGTMGRVMAPPTRTFGGFGPGGGVDSRGRLVYAQIGPATPAIPCTPGQNTNPPPPTNADSGLIVRADWETRTLDTIARNRGAIPGQPLLVRDAECRITAVKWPINPIIPTVDTWAMTSQGVLAIIRGGDYHMDFVYADGRKVSGPKMPFDWRRINDIEKQAKIDSAKRLFDSVSAAGGYRARACGNVLAGITLGPPPVPGAGGGGAGGGGGRGGGDGPPAPVRAEGRGADGPVELLDCKWNPMTPAFPALSDMPDYFPPIRQIVPKADADGNVWILPTTSLAAKDGLLYDVVNPKGELIERVQLPADRDIVGFGRGGVLFLSRRDGPGRVFIERVKIVR